MRERLIIYNVLIIHVLVISCLKIFNHNNYTLLFLDMKKQTIGMGSRKTQNKENREDLSIQERRKGPRNCGEIQIQKREQNRMSKDSGQI